MKKLFVLISLALVFTFPSHALAQSMMGATSDNHTAQEEAEGKEIWEKLQTKELGCQELNGDNYAALGEYFMGQTIGDTQRHAAMNQMMISMMGEEGEEQIHIAMGKRLSGCEPNAPVPQNMMVGMMSMMMGGGGNPMGSFGWGFSWIFMILFWALVILGIVALVKWIANQEKSQTQEKSVLDILKERYAKGEINKKEFEEKKKDLI